MSDQIRKLYVDAIIKHIHPDEEDHPPFTIGFCMGGLFYLICLLIGLTPVGFPMTWKAHVFVRWGLVFGICVPLLARLHRGKNSVREQTRHIYMAMDENLLRARMEVAVLEAAHHKLSQTDSVARGLALAFLFAVMIPNDLAIISFLREVIGLG